MTTQLFAGWDPIEIWGSRETRLFEFVHAKALALSPETQSRFSGSGYIHLGQINFSDGSPRSEFKVPIDEAMTDDIARGFVRLLERATEKVIQDMQDPRNIN